MKAFISVSSCIAIFFSQVFVLAKQAPPPDLAGVWKLNPAKSKLSKIKTPQSQILEIKCSGLSIQMTFTTDGRQSSSHSYTADGIERSLREPQDTGESVVRARWKKNVLTIETTAHVKPPNDVKSNQTLIFHSMTHWTLSIDGQVLTSKEDYTGTSFVYEKQLQ